MPDHTLLDLAESVIKVGGKIKDILAHWKCWRKAVLSKDSIFLYASHLDLNTHELICTTVSFTHSAMDE